MVCYCVLQWADRSSCWSGCQGDPTRAALERLLTAAGSSGFAAVLSYTASDATLPTCYGLPSYMLPQEASWRDSRGKLAAAQSTSCAKSTACCALLNSWPCSCAFSSRAKPSAGAESWRHYTRKRCREELGQSAPEAQSKPVRSRTIFLVHRRNSARVREIS